LCLSALLLTLTGCRLFEQGASAIGRRTALFRPNQYDSSSSRHDRVPPSQDIVRLETTFVERPINDPLWGPALWREADEVSDLDPGLRRKLRRNGFRVGHLGSSPPRVLATRLGWKMQIPDHRTSRSGRKPVARPVVLRSGDSADIQTSEWLRTLTVTISDTGRDEPTTLKNARCVLRLSVSRLQDGWARLEFVPEIHSGPNRWRSVSTQSGWSGRTTQKITALYDQRFTVDLSLGEMVMISADPQSRDTLGRRFFIGTGESGETQRLLLVRLVDLKKAEAVYSR